LPEENAGADRFAVCWNGLVYPVVKFGALADLRADVVALVQADDAMRAKAAKDRPDWPFYRFRHATPESLSVSEKGIAPLKACLLLRLGENDLARSVWTAWTAGMRANVNDDNEHLRDPYLMLATDWTWAMFDRAVCAHMRGDDRLSLLDARALSVLGPLVEAEAGKRKFPQREDESDSRVRDRKAPYLDFLAPVPALLTDGERRVAQAPRSALPAGASQAQIIAALILELDEIAARQMGQPGGVALGGRSMQLLVAHGEAAIEPLLRVMENDTRLTRSVSFHRNFFRSRHLLTVSQAAYNVLTRILKTDEFGGALGEDRWSDDLTKRRSLARRIRAHWSKFKGVSLQERWYRTLQDDKAGQAAWLQAAANIVTPPGEYAHPFGLSHSVSFGAPRGKEKRAAGESLRAKTRPSVSELMTRRTREITEEARALRWLVWNIAGSAQMALALARWDARAALPLLREQTRLCLDVKSADEQEVSQAGPILVALTLSRVRLADAAALPQYAAWMRRAPLTSLFHGEMTLLEPLVRYPRNAAMENLNNWLWNDAQSPWSRFLGGKTVSFLDDVFETPLLRTPGFKKHVLRELVNTAYLGTIRLNKPENINSRGELAIVLNAKGFSMDMGEGAVKPDPFKPAPGVTGTFRVCDFYAWMLYRRQKQWKHAPRFELYWPQAKRDAAVRQSAAFVRSH